MCNVYPRQSWWPLFLGSIVEAAGIAALAYAFSTGVVPTILGIVAFTGVGTGLRMMPG